MQLQVVALEVTEAKLFSKGTTNCKNKNKNLQQCLIIQMWPPPNVTVLSNLSIDSKSHYKGLVNGSLQCTNYNWWTNSQIVTHFISSFSVKLSSYQNEPLVLQCLKSVKKKRGNSIPVTCFGAKFAVSKITKCADSILVWTLGFKGIKSRIFITFTL